jgi:hypothetical protein
MPSGTPCIAAAMFLNNRDFWSVEQPVEGANLAVIVVARAMIIAGGIARDRQRRLAVGTIFRRSAKGVRLVIDVCPLWRVETHLTVKIVGVHRTFRPVDGQRFIVGPDPVAVHIGVGKMRACSILSGDQLTPRTTARSAVGRHMWPATPRARLLGATR